MDATRTEEYRVLVEINTATGHRVTESWLRDGKLHREFGPAVRTFDETTGELESEKWMIEGEPHRDHDLPCETVWDTETGRIEHETYMVRGKLHRDGDRPAQVSYDPNNGRTVREEYWIDNELHRDALAAIIVRDPVTGNVRWEAYYKHGYRLSLPDRSPDPT